MIRLKRVTDAMLKIAVPQDEAGACVPTVGNRCQLSGYHYKCVDHTKYRCKIYGEVSCTGPCSNSHVTYGDCVSYSKC